MAWRVIAVRRCKFCRLQGDGRSTIAILASHEVESEDAKLLKLKCRDMTGIDIIFSTQDDQLMDRLKEFYSMSHESWSAGSYERRETSHPMNIKRNSAWFLSDPQSRANGT